jgi:methylenetetrahydrofolate dehydrogenase (NADP+) / methenyltetrahydrofolate cyclohydrolase
MRATIINGTEIARVIREEVSAESSRLRTTCGIVPGLVTILAGDNPASLSYVTAKQKAARELGFHSIQDDLPATITEAQLLERIRGYNTNPAVHGILVQLPLPAHINEQSIVNAIDPDKDVDGFHPVNLGRLMLGGDAVRFAPCTPAGIQQLLNRSGIMTEGAEVVVVGRSNIVGKPIAAMLQQKAVGANATVTVAHTRTRDLALHCRRADILIVAAGVPGLVRAEWIKPGAAVIDVGVNRVGEKVSAATGRTIAVLRGDVDFDKALCIAGYITPVPGGVGPMTIAMLMVNTVRAAGYASGAP